MSIDSGLLQRALHQLHDSEAGGQEAALAPTSSSLEVSKPVLSENAAVADQPTSCRNFKMQVAVDCGHMGLSVSGTQLATVTWVHLEVNPCCCLLLLHDCVSVRYVHAVGVLLVLPDTGGHSALPNKFTTR